MNDLDISVVVPVYNEAGNIEPFVKRCLPVLERIASTYEIIFCLDPCADNTEEVIRNLASNISHIKLIVFSRRFGQPAATIAGILNSKGAAVVVIDVDLQDPPELIESLYKKMNEGFEVVYATRRSRSGETLLKKMIAYFGYAVINKFSDVEIPRNTGDFRIISRKVIAELTKLHEVHGFLRGLISYIGFPQAAILYDRDRRFIGSGNYNRFTGSFKIGLNGLISFSSKPLAMMSIAGFLLSGFSFFLAIFYLIQKIIGFNITPGLTTTVIFMSFYSGVQLLGLGLIGEYVGRIYDEVKNRPMYIIDKKINFEDNEK